MPEFKRLINDNVFTILPRLKDNTFSLILSDVPYNLGSEWIIADDGSFQIKGKGSDYMGKWDALTGKDLDIMFKEFNRILKYGGFCVLFGLDNQIAPFQYYAVKHGFDVCQSLYWYYLSSMPKATDVSYIIDKKLGVEKERPITGVKQNTHDGYTRNSETHKSPSETSNTGEWGLKNSPHGQLQTRGFSPLAQKFDGYKYSKKPLKQVVETVMVFRKKCKNGSVLNDLLAYENDKTISPSIINIDENRVPTTDKLGGGSLTNDAMIGKDGWDRPWRTDPILSVAKKERQKESVEKAEKLGRYPANAFIDDGAAQALDSQSGILKSGKDKNPTNEPVSGFFGQGMKYYNKEANYGDSGGASRILHRCNYEDIDNIDLFIYNPKTSPSERDAGCSVKNLHPTLKPVKLIESISKLFLLPEECNQKVLIPFSGVLSEVLGCVKAGFNPENITAIEINKQYCEIGKERYKYWTNLWEQGSNNNE